MTATLRWLGVLGVAAMVGAYLGPKIFSDSDTIDFKYIWLAGELWTSGENPYTHLFSERGGVIFADYNHPVFWVYPPNWWPVATALASLSYEVAGTFWRVLSIGFLFLGCFVVSRALWIKDTFIPVWRHLTFWCLSATMSATAITLSLGQTSMLAFLGVCLFVAAILRRSQVIMVAALVLLALKPTLGLVMVVALFPARFWWSAILGAGVITTALAAPAVLQHGGGDVFGAMLAKLEAYGLEAVNMPPEMTGLRHLAFRIASVELGTFTCLGLGMVASFTSGILMHREVDSPNLPAVLALLLSVTAFFVPLHTYDLIFITLLFLLTAGLSFAIQVFCTFGVLLLWRANNFEEITGLKGPETIYFGGSFLSSVMLLFLLLALLASTMRVGKHNISLRV